jgi:uncharacterized cupredoxin-like copper-binding protein
MRRRLVVAFVLVLALAAAPSAAPALLDVGATVSVSPLGGNAYNVMIQNTDTQTFITSLTFAPGPGFTVTSVTGNDVGGATCTLAGTGFSCSGLQLVPYQCECHPGGIVNVGITATFTGSGGPSGTLSQIGTAPAFAAGGGTVKSTGTTTGGAAGTTAGTTTPVVTVQTGKPTAVSCKVTPGKVKHGTVTFKVTNADASGVRHAFTIGGKTTKALARGSGATLTVKFAKAGKYSYSCSAPGVAGMTSKGTLTVT